MKRTVVVALGLSVLLAPVPAMADSIDIQVLSVTYKAAIDFGFPYDLTSDPLSSPVSVSGFIPDTFYAPESGLPLASASAAAGWLSVETHSSSICCPTPMVGAASRAEFDLTFSSLLDGVGTLDLNHTLGGPYTQGFASLFDMTTGQELWRYDVVRNGGDHLVIGGVFIDSPNALLPLSLATTFNTTDVYRLHLLVEGDSLGDSTSNDFQVTGLHDVPEPSSLVLLGLGIGTTLTARRRLRKRLDQ